MNVLLFVAVGLNVISAILNLVLPPEPNALNKFFGVVSILLLGTWAAT